MTLIERLDQEIAKLQIKIQRSLENSDYNFEAADVRELLSQARDRIWNLEQREKVNMELYMRRAVQQR